MRLIGAKRIPCSPIVHRVAVRVAVKGTMYDAILLVGGEGTRLRPLTCHTPKPMLPIAGRPITELQLARLSAAGVTRVSLATAYKAEVFSEYFGAGHAGIPMLYAVEESPLGTGGAIRNAAALLDGHPDDPVIVFNGDILGGHDIAAQIAAHIAQDADITLHLVTVEDPRAFGVVPTDESGRVTAFLEKTPNPPTNRINAGCYIFRRRIIAELISEGNVVSVERDTFPKALELGFRVISHTDDAYWLDLGTPAAYVKGSADMVSGILASPLPADGVPVGGGLIGPHGHASPQAALLGGTYVSAGAAVGAGSTVDASIVLEGAVIRRDCQIRNSIIGRGAQIGEGAVLDGAVIGDHAVIGAHNALANGSRIWPNVHLPAGAIRLDGANPGR